MQQDDIQHWRRVRKAMAALLGDGERGTLTWTDAKARIAEVRDLALARESAYAELLRQKAEAQATSASRAGSSVG